MGAWNRIGKRVAEPYLHASRLTGNVGWLISSKTEGGTHLQEREVSVLRSVIFFLFMAIAFAVGILIQQSGVLHMSTTSYLKLSEPLLLNADGEAKYFHMLPAGTAMYPDYTAPEGYTRYIVYVNVKGEFLAESVVSEKKNLIDPIWAYTVKKDDLSQLMRDVPISKDDLTRILKARKVTRDELAQIVREWQD